MVGPAFQVREISQFFLPRYIIHIVSIINMIINPIVIPTTKFLGNITHRIHGAAIYGNMDPINIHPLC